MTKFFIVPFVVAALWSCSATEKEKLAEQEDEIEDIEIVEVDSTYIDEQGRMVGVMLAKWPTYDPYSDRWEGPGAERINRVWCGRIALDTVAPVGERKWKWTISEEEKNKMSKEDIRLGDSLIKSFNDI